jgi:hypothetical protein
VEERHPPSQLNADLFQPANQTLAGDMRLRHDIAHVDPRHGRDEMLPAHSIDCALGPVRVLKCQTASMWVETCPDATIQRTA